MNRLDRPVTVLCVFSGESPGPPTPHKFKIKYRDGSTRTVSVDNIRFVEPINPGSVTTARYVYHCQSEVEGSLIEYELMFIKADMTWTLYRVV